MCSGSFNVAFSAPSTKRKKTRNATLLDWLNKMILKRSQNEGTVIRGWGRRQLFSSSSSSSSFHSLVHTLAWSREYTASRRNRLNDERTEQRKKRKGRLRATPPGGVKIQNNTAWWSEREQARRESEKRKDNKTMKIIINRRQTEIFFLFSFFDTPSRV